MTRRNRAVKVMIAVQGRVVARVSSKRKYANFALKSLRLIIRIRMFSGALRLIVEKYFLGALLVPVRSISVLLLSLSSEPELLLSCPM